MRILYLSERDADAELVRRALARWNPRSSVDVVHPGELSQELRDERCPCDVLLARPSAINAAPDLRDQLPGVPLLVLFDPTDPAPTLLNTGDRPAVLVSLRKSLAGEVEIPGLDDALELARSRRRADATAALDAVDREELDLRFSTALDLFCIAGAQGTFLWLSPGWERVLGHPRSHMLGRRAVEFIHPDDVPEVQEAAVRMRERGEIVDFTTRYRHRDGSYRRLQWRARVEGGRTYASARDITDLVAGQEQLHLLSAALRAAANAIVITDRSGTIEWANPAFEELTGYPIEEAIGRNPHELLKSGEHDEAFYREMWATILEGAVWQGEIVNRRKDGTRYVEDQTITPVRGDSGEITHFVAIKQDATLRKRTEGQLRQAQKMEGVGRLAGGVAHDFNNILMVINTTAQMLASELPEEDGLRDEILEILEAGRRASRLTRQLLSLSRPDAARPRAVDLNELVKGMDGLLRRTLGHDLETTVRAQEGLPPVHADPGQLEQVLLNLAVNARDAMPTGGRLTIETQAVHLDPISAGVHPHLSEGPYVILTVSDTGTGMDAETREHMFEPYFTTKSADRGTGLGLATVYGIVRESGGDVTVYSEVGQGTTIRLYLPALKKEAGMVDTSSEPVVAEGREMILLVEDDPGVRSVTARILMDAGYSVRETGSGSEALGMLENGGRADLVLVDFGLPDLSGPELARQIEKQSPGSRLLFTSGHPPDALDPPFSRGNGMHFLGKPYTAGQLSRSVRRVLDG